MIHTTICNEEKFYMTYFRSKMADLQGFERVLQSASVLLWGLSRVPEFVVSYFYP